MNTKQFVIGKLLIAWMATAAVHGTLFAGGPKWAHVTPVNESQALNVYVQLPDTQKFTMSVFGEDQGILWSRDYKDDAVEQSVLIDALPDGIYRFAVKTGERYIAYPFSVSDGRVLVQYRNAVERQMPKMEIVSGGFAVDYSSAKAAASVRMRILDDSNEVIFRQRLSGPECKKVRYDLTETPNGVYLVQFQIDGGTWFSQRVHLYRGSAELQ